MLNAEFYRGCCCKCFIPCILNNQGVTSIWLCVAEGWMTVSERDCFSSVSGSGLCEPVLLMLRLILGWSLRGLSGLRKKVSVRSRFLTSVRNNLIRLIFRVYNYLFFRDTSIVTQNIWALFVITDFMHRHILLVIVCISVRIFWYPLPNLAVNWYVTRACFVILFFIICSVCYLGRLEV